MNTRQKILLLEIAVMVVNDAEMFDKIVNDLDLTEVDLDRLHWAIKSYTSEVSHE